MWQIIIRNITKVPIPVQQEYNSYSIISNYYINYYQSIIIIVKNSKTFKFIIININQIAIQQQRKQFNKLQMTSSYSKNHHQSTILVKGQTREMSSTHPLFYVQAKNYFLQQLSNKVSVENRLGAMDLKRNVRIDQFVQRHQKVQKQIQKQKRINKTYLKSTQFQSVLFGDAQNRKKNRQQKQEQKLRQKLYECYIQENNVHEEPEKDIANNDYEQWKMSQRNKGKGNFTILSNYREDPVGRKQLYLLDLQISKIRQEQNRQKILTQNRELCSNNRLLQKVSNSIMSSFLVYFDQIWDVLIDQIIQEEVCFLNKLQAEYYLNASEKAQQHNNSKGRNDPYENARVLKMMELVKQLDQLSE